MRLIPALLLALSPMLPAAAAPLLIVAHRGASGERPEHTLAAYERAIDAGDAEAGCSVHVVTPELDDGPVVAQARVAILPGDTPDTLADRVLVEEHRLYPAALAQMARKLR